MKSGVTTNKNRFCLFVCKRPPAVFKKHFISNEKDKCVYKKKTEIKISTFYHYYSCTRLHSILVCVCVCIFVRSTNLNSALDSKIFRRQRRRRRRRPQSYCSWWWSFRTSLLREICLFLSARCANCTNLLIKRIQYGYCRFNSP